MGIRLYPITKNPASLEKLAGVAPGTFARLGAVEKRHMEEVLTSDKSEQYELGYRHYKEIKGDMDLAKLHDMKLFGWGKFNPAGVAEGDGGEITDLATAGKVLMANGIAFDAEFLELTEGIHWG